MDISFQNNLERIESETKRNLQYQVEKLEKENSILKTKFDNANEEYRSAVKIWEVISFFFLLPCLYI